MKKKNLLIYAVAAIVAVAAIGLLYAHFNNTGGSSGNQLHNITVGASAPDYGFLLTNNGQEANLSQYKGQETLLWFVATWCPSCAQGNQAINSNYKFFKQHKVKIIELEMYKDLGYSGPSIYNFVNSYAPDAYSNGTITPALAGYNMTAAYDPEGYLDIYYLLSGSGNVIYISGSPESTMPQLMNAVNSSAE